MKIPNKISRRAVLAGFAAPFILPASIVFGSSHSGSALVIGCGNRGKMLATILTQIRERPTILGFVDLDEKKAVMLRDKIGSTAPVFPSLDAALSAGIRPDMGIIATYNNAHLPDAKKLLDIGAHVYTEKPMTATLDEALEMIELDRSSGGRIQVGLQFRHAPLYAKVKAIIDSGMIGSVRYIAATELRGDWFRFHLKDPETENRTNWRYFEETCGNSVLEKLCHDFDILCHVASAKPNRVIASGGKAVFKNRETDDHASIILEFDRQQKIDISFSLFSNARRHETVIMGEKGTISFERTGEEISFWEARHYARTKPDTVIDVNQEKTSAYGYHGTQEGLIAFVQTTTNGSPHYPDPSDAWLSTAVCCGAHYSLRNGSAPVDLTTGRFNVNAF